jgi:Putative Flp pilus-assembly TadE/G-like
MRTHSRLPRFTRWRREDGQALIFVMLAMPILLAFAALVIDGGNLIVQKRLVQNAADSAALAAAQDLSGAGSCDDACRVKVSSTVGNYSSDNGASSGLHRCVDADHSNPSDSNCYAAPYVDKAGVSHGDLVEVRLRKSVSTFFAGLIGVSNLSVAARAVANASRLTSTSTTTTPGSTTPGVTTPGTTVYNSSTSSSTVTTTTASAPLALFAYTHGGADPCTGTGVTVTGNPQTKIGAVVSNGPVHLGLSSSNTFTGLVGYAGYGPPTKNCSLTKFGTGVVTASEHIAAPLPWQRTFNRSAICTGNDSSALRTLNDPADGIYCSTVGINVTGLRATSRVTFVAPYVTIASTINAIGLSTAPALSSPLNPNHDLVVWQYGAGQNFTFDHQNSHVDGVIWIENGDLSFVGNSGATGFYQAQNVSVVGNSYVMAGSGPIAGTSTTTVSSTTTTATTTPGVTIPGTTLPGNTVVSTNITGTTVGLSE